MAADDICSVCHRKLGDHTIKELEACQGKK